MSDKERQESESHGNDDEKEYGTDGHGIINDQGPSYMRGCSIPSLIALGLIALYVIVCIVHYFVTK